MVLRVMLILFVLCFPFYGCTAGAPKNETGGRMAVLCTFVFSIHSSSVAYQMQIVSGCKVGEPHTVHKLLSALPRGYESKLYIKESLRTIDICSRCSYMIGLRRYK